MTRRSLNDGRIGAASITNYGLIGGIAAALMGFGAAAWAVDIPAGVAGAPGSANTPGFGIRTVQAPLDPPLAQELLRGIRQLNGTLVDALGDPVPNEAMPGPGPGGTHPFTGIINFEKEATPDIGNFFDDVLFPGIPGTNFHTENFSTEVVAFLELSAGEHRFGAQVWIERTDIGDGGDDDNLGVYVGTNPRDFFATKLTEYSRSAEAPAFSSVPDDHEFTFTAPEDGVYPFRFVYVQKTRGATLELYSVNGGFRVPLNDPGSAEAVKAYQVSTSPNHGGAYVGEVSPIPGTSGVAASEPIDIVLIDDGTAVELNSIKLFLNDNEVSGGLEIERDAATGRTFLRYQPDPGRGEQQNNLRLEFGDGVRTQTREWAFGNAGAAPGPPKVTGYWDFSSGDLKATIGRDLEFFGNAARDFTQFGTTTALGAPDINGQPANIMAVPPDRNKEVGYVIYHGIAPNGGGTRVNQYTLIMDVYAFDEGPGFAGIIQVDSPQNNGDADIFWNKGAANMGQGTGGYGGLGEFTSNTWHRIALAVDLAATPPVVTKFVNGVKQEDWIQQRLDQPRRALLEPCVIFTDGDDGEQHGWYVSAVQILDGKMSDADLEALGGPTADGLPATSSVPFAITKIERNAETGDVTLTWNSRPGRSYAIEASNELSIWLELDDSYPSQGEQTRFTERAITIDGAKVRHYRVREE